MRLAPTLTLLSPLSRFSRFVRLIISLPVSSASSRETNMAPSGLAENRETRRDWLEQRCDVVIDRNSSFIRRDRGHHRSSRRFSYYLPVVQIARRFEYAIFRKSRLFLGKYSTRRQFLSASLGGNSGLGFGILNLVILAFETANQRRRRRGHLLRKVTNVRATPQAFETPKKGFPPLSTSSLKPLSLSKGNRVSVQSTAD